MHTPIVLIGPMAAGKSTIAALLSEKLGIPRFEVDEHRWTYYAAQGYDNRAGEKIYAEQGINGLIKHWKPYEAETVVRIINDQPDSVIDFGAGHSVYEDAGLFAKVEAVLKPLPNVILLLPSADLDESVRICNECFIAQLSGENIEPDADTLALNEHFVKHPSNGRLAKLTIYTEGKSAEDTVAEIIPQLTKT